MLSELTGLGQLQVPICEETLSAENVEKFKDWRRRRLKGEPVTRIVGRRGFWTLDLDVSPATLDPRPDSETLIELALRQLAERRSEALNILDLGTGSGALLLAMLSECPEAQGVGVDVSYAALLTARSNALKSGLDERAAFVCGSWLAAIDERFDVVISNPPYIASEECERLPDEVRLYDPHMALDGGIDGLDAYRAIADSVFPRLKNNGIFIVEIGYDQYYDVQSLFENSGFCLAAVKPDLGGHIRALCFETA